MGEVAGGGAEAASAGAAAGTLPHYESDFSPRKIRIGLAILLGQTLATNVLPITALALLFGILHKEFGWTRAQYALASSALLLVGAASAILVGYLVDKFLMRPLIVVATVGLAIATMAISRTTDLRMFCILFGVLGFFGSMTVGYNKLVTALFQKNRGKALAIFGAETAVAAAIAPQLINFLIGHYGWRQSFLIEGILILVCAPILYFAIEEPGTTGRESKGARSKPAELAGLTFVQALRDPVLWLLLIAAVISVIPRGGLFPFMQPILGERGFAGRQVVANVVSVLTLMQAVGSLAMGFCLDKFDTAKIAVPFQLLAVLSMALITVVSASFGGAAMLTLAFALWGFSAGTLRPAGRYFQARFFGLKSFGMIMGLDDFVPAFATGLMAPLIGWSADRTGSFDLALWATAGAVFVSAVIYFLLRPYRYGVMIGAAPTAENGQG